MYVCMYVVQLQVVDTGKIVFSSSSSATMSLPVNLLDHSAMLIVGGIDRVFAHSEHSSTMGGTGGIYTHIHAYSYYIIISLCITVCSIVPRSCS